MNSMVTPVIPAAKTPEIRSREDFLSLLENATVEIDGFVAREPAYPVWGVLQRQLHAMRDWTANGADPTPAEQGRISIGLVAARELEPAPDAAIEALVTRLHLLNYYWRHWPSRSVTVPASPPLLAQNQFANNDAARATQPRGQRRLRLPPLNMTILLASSLLLFLVACCLPALEFKNTHNKPDDIMYGLRALAVGWSGIFAGVYAWYANPCWLLALILAFFQRPTTATIVAIVAVAVAATTFALIGRELPGDEGNVTRTTVVRLLPGCYVWMSSIAVLLLSAFFRDRN